MNTPRFAPHMPRQRASRLTIHQAAFSLLELMIVVAIIGIIVAVALPNYSDHVTRSKITEATSQLGVKQTVMEQYFQDNRTYVAAPACTADTTTSKNFDFTCPAEQLSASGFQILATGKDSMLGFSFAITNTGAKSTVTVPSGWSLPSPNNCWVQKRSGSC